MDSQDNNQFPPPQFVVDQSYTVNMSPEFTVNDYSASVDVQSGVRSATTTLTDDNAAEEAAVNTAIFDEEISTLYTSTLDLMAQELDMQREHIEWLMELFEQEPSNIVLRRMINTSLTNFNNAMNNFNQMCNNSSVF